MAREAGQYRKMLLEQQSNRIRRTDADWEWETGFSWGRIRFYVSLALFLAYVFLDYTGAAVYDMDSSRILAQIQKDMTQELHIDDLLARLLDQVEITDEPALPASTVPEEGIRKETGDS